MDDRRCGFVCPFLVLVIWSVVFMFQVLLLAVIYIIFMLFIMTVFCPSFCASLFYFSSNQSLSMIPGLVPKHR